MSEGVPYIKPLPIWTPASLSTLGWYDAADAATIVESGGDVSQWNDKSGAGRDLTGAGTALPRTGVRQLNGLNVLDCDGTGYLYRNSFPASGPNLSVFVVAVLDAIDDVNDAVFSTGASKDFGLVAGNASQFDGDIVCVGASNPPSTPLSGGPFPGPSIYNAKVGTDDFRIRAYIDGTLRADTGYIGAISGSFTFRVFSCRLAACFPDGAIAEVVAVGTATTTQRQLIEGYLAWKWGIQAKLPGGHPYETHPPFI